MPNPTIERRIIEGALVPAFFTAAICLALVTILSLADAAYASLALVYLRKQDVFLALLATAIISASLVRLDNRDIPEARPWKIWIAVIATALVVFVGRHLILHDYDMSRDEQMASFDAAVFAAGRLAAPLSQPWLHQAEALNTDFMLPVADRSAWISGYLPINAAIRGIFDLAGASQLVGPLAIVVGAIALSVCVQKIWPGRTAYRWIALLLYLGSGQVLTNAMTNYAMPLHLAFNLIWLSLFLERRVSFDLAALIVGFLAVGLHQPIFHPMFVAPILATLLISKDWPRAALYFFGYALIGAFWAYWPSITIDLTGVPLPGDQQSYLTRLQNALDTGRPAGLLEMIANLLRFVTWQHVLLLPLLIMGLRAALQNTLIASLAAGVILTITVMTIILPYQGHGFGYRYLHGLIGSAILLALHGWDRIDACEVQWRSLMHRTSVGTFLLLIPAQFYFANTFYAPYARAAEELGNLDSEYVVISGHAAPFAVDLVINEPFLQDRPILLIQERLNTDLISDICEDGSQIVFVEEPFFDGIRSYYSMPPLQNGALDNGKLTMVAQESGCVVL